MYVTKAEVKEYLNLTDANSDALIDELIARVEAVAQADKCQRTFGSSTFVEYLDGDGGDMLLLQQYPIISIDHIYDDLERDYDAASELDVEDIAVYEQYGKIVFVNGSFTQGIQNIKVEYHAGYIVIPDDLKLALIKTVAAELIGARAQVNAIKSDGETDIDDRPKRLKKEADEVFKAYRRIV